MDEESQVTEEINEEEGEEHFVCNGGCGIVAKRYRKCSTVGCVRNRNPLVRCTCNDGLHKAVLKTRYKEALKNQKKREAQIQENLKRIEEAAKVDA